MEELIEETGTLRTAKPDMHPPIDISYVELPARLTSKVNMSNVLGAISFLAMIAAPGAVEGEMYITAITLIAICGICAHLSMKEDGKRK